MSINTLQAYLASRGMAVSIDGGTKHAAFYTLKMRLMGTTTVAAIRASLDDIALHLKVDAVRLSLDSGTVSLQVPTKQVRRISYDTLMQSIQIPQLTSLLGLNEFGRTMWVNWQKDDTPHVLIAGTTGSGKTNLMRVMLLSLAARTKASKVGIVWIDLKHSEETAFTRAIYNHTVARPIGDTDMVEALRRVSTEMKSRTPGGQWPRIIVAVDEVAELVQRGGEDVVNLMTSVAQYGREVGVHLLAGTQRPSSALLGGLMRANLPVRIVGRVLSAVDANVATGLKQTGAHALHGQGDFLCVSSKIVRFMAPLCEVQDAGIPIEVERVALPPPSKPALPSPIPSGRLKEWASEQLQVGGTMTASEGYKAYKDWCDAKGIEAVTVTKWGIDLNKTFEKERGPKGTEYIGVSLKR